MNCQQKTCPLLPTTLIQHTYYIFQTFTVSILPAIARTTNPCEVLSASKQWPPFTLLVSNLSLVCLFFIQSLGPCPMTAWTLHDYRTNITSLTWHRFPVPGRVYLPPASGLVDNPLRGPCHTPVIVFLASVSPLLLFTSSFCSSSSSPHPTLFLWDSHCHTFLCQAKTCSSPLP